MLAVLAEPLIHSVQKFSSSANIPSFYVAFVLVPLATSARTAISAIRAVREKIPKSTLLTFSEVCRTVTHCLNIISYLGRIIFHDS